MRLHWRQTLVSFSYTLGQTLLFYSQCHFKRYIPLKYIEIHPACPNIQRYQISTWTRLIVPLCNKCFYFYFCDVSRWEELLHWTNMHWSRKIKTKDSATFSWLLFSIYCSFISIFVSNIFSDSFDHSELPRNVDSKLGRILFTYVRMV